MDGNFCVGDGGACGEVPKKGGVERLDGVSVGDAAASFAVKVDVFLDVGAVAGLGAFDLDQFDEAVTGEVLKAVVDGGEGDAGGAAFDAVKNVVGGGVVGGFGQDLEDFAPMGGKAGVGAEHGQTAVQAGGLGGGGGGGFTHWCQKLGFRIRTRMILIQMGNGWVSGWDAFFRRRSFFLSGRGGFGQREGREGASPMI